MYNSEDVLFLWRMYNGRVRFKEIDRNFLEQKITHSNNNIDYYRSRCNILFLFCTLEEVPLLIPILSRSKKEGSA